MGAEFEVHHHPTPVSAAVVEVMHEVEAGTREPVPQNIELALRRAGV